MSFSMNARSSSFLDQPTSSAFASFACPEAEVEAIMCCPI
jgi:hypothetical protein